MDYPSCCCLLISGPFSCFCLFHLLHVSNLSFDRRWASAAQEKLTEDHQHLDTELVMFSDPQQCSPLQWAVSPEHRASPFCFYITRQSVNTFLCFWSCLTNTIWMWWEQTYHLLLQNTIKTCGIKGCWVSNCGEEQSHWKLLTISSSSLFRKTSIPKTANCLNPHEACRILF